MNQTDIIVLIIILIPLCLLIFFRYIKPYIGKNKNKPHSGCSCCPLGNEMKAKRVFKEYYKTEKKKKNLER
ncbi:MAG: hypothetical protein WCR97_04550 [Bacilli bacterium]